MTEYAPDTEYVCYAYMRGEKPRKVSADIRKAEFDRWLSSLLATARADGATRMIQLISVAANREQNKALTDYSSGRWQGLADAMKIIEDHRAAAVPLADAALDAAVASLDLLDADHATDADFIAHARTDIPLLLAEVDRLNEVIAFSPEPAYVAELRKLVLEARKRIADAWDEGAAKADENHYMMRNGMVPNPYRSLAEGKTE